MCAESFAARASTQLAVHDIYGAKQLESMGFSRVVLSVSFPFEIKHIAENLS